MKWCNSILFFITLKWTIWSKSDFWSSLWWPTIRTDRSQGPKVSPMNHKISHRSKLPKKTLLQTSNRIPSSHKPHKSSNLHQSNPLNLKSSQNRWFNKFKRMLSMKILILIFLRMSKRWMMIWLMSMRKNQPCARLLTISMGRVKLVSINRFVSSREKLGRKLLLLRNWFVPSVLSKLRSLRFDIMDLIFVLYSIEFNYFLDQLGFKRLKDLKRICRRAFKFTFFKFDY